MSLKVEDVMVEQVLSVSEEATVKEAAELMNQNEIGCLIVVNNGNPIGIVTETDMVKRVILGAVDPEKTKVWIIMSSPLIVVDPQMNLEEASKIMRERKIKKLPVIEKGHLVGLVTMTDIVRSPEVMKMMIRTIKRNIIKELMASIEEKLELEK
ncbi:MAG: CBS domain-containing protein [Candidatus Bathyarchaeota archaeon]|nr:CBS domain-containing protein [Candidatus Bathyarchaeota archaeon]